jgi:SAM-dependent methyltransferase
MKILDATCGHKTIWYQKNHPFVTFMDKRKGTIARMTNNTKLKHRRFWDISPDVVSEWKDAPFPDNTFDMIVFDPPHIIRDKNKSSIAMEKAYGVLYSDNWRLEIKEGVHKLFDILKPNGIFILKWCENSIPVDKIIELMPYHPLFGTRTGQKNKNHWIVFLKYRMEKELDIR